MGSSDLLETKKCTMKERFQSPKILKDGTMGKILEMPDTITLQLDTRYRKEWIEYSALDAQLTWDIREVLEQKLRALDWNIGGVKQGSLWDYYTQYWIDFGELLT